MRPSTSIRCAAHPCADVRRASCIVPGIDVRPERVKMVLVCEAAPSRRSDYFYAGGKALFEETTVQAFQDAGAEVGSIRDILSLGVYLTTAVKCGKTGYSVAPQTIRECSRLLEKELALFPRIAVLMLMGDIAIKALNAIASRVGEPRVIPAGSTYRLRGANYSFQGIRVLPSYLQAGPAFFIEKTKRRMIAEDIALGLRLAR